MSGQRGRVLQVRELRSGYDALEVLKGVNLDVGEAEVVALIGSNGAGKTTLIRTLSGLLPVRSGQVAYGTTDLTRATPMQVVASGCVVVPEGRGIFPALTVRENLKLGAYWRRKSVRLDDEIEDVVARFPRLKERFGQLAGSLSGGEQQMLAIGRALLAAPSLLMLDEPSMGLSPLFARTVLQVVAELRNSGVSILLVEQNAEAALRISDRAYVMERGEIVFDGPAAAVRNDPRIRAAYLGDVSQEGTESLAGQHAF